VCGGVDWVCPDCGALVRYDHECGEFEQPPLTPGCLECDNDDGVACARCHAKWLNRTSPLEEEE
jgi:hypothetical protein